MNQAQLKAMAASYGRSVLAGVVALYTAGVTDPKDMWAALVAALVPVVLRAANPKDKSFGKFDAVAKDVDDATITEPFSSSTRPLFHSTTPCCNHSGRFS